jgi:iron(III) transport system permease protein
MDVAVPVQRKPTLTVEGRHVVTGVALIPLLLAVVLLVVVALIAFREASGMRLGAFTFANFDKLFGDPVIYRILANTAGFAIISVLVAVCAAVPLAWLAERTNLPGRSAIFPLMALTMVIPTFFTAMGWAFLFDPRMGMVNRWIVDYLGWSPLNIATVAGMSWVEGLSLVALTFVMIAASFRAMDPTLEECAEIHSIPMLRRLRTVTLPLVWPGVLAAGIYVLTIAIGAFDVPAVIGMSNGILLLSTFIFNKSQPEDMQPEYGLVGASAVLMLVLAVFLTWWYLRVIGAAERFAVVTGKAYRPKLVDLKGWRWLAWSYVALLVLLTVGLPLLALIWAAITPYLQPFSWDALSRVSLNQFRGIPWRSFWVAAQNTAILMLVVPTMTALFGLCISWVVVRHKIRGGALIDGLAFVPHVVPHIIFAVGAILLSLYWLPEYLSLYGTLSIIIITYVVARISFATRMYNSALLQLHRELDEAGYVFGLGTIKVLWHIIRPLIMPSLLYSWVWMALLTLRELAMAALLVTGENNTIPMFIWGIWTDSSLNQAAAVSVLFMLMILPIIFLYFMVGRRMLAVGGKS